MRTLKTSEAAAMLNVSPNTLRAWERRFGYPRPQVLPPSLDELGRRHGIALRAYRVRASTGPLPTALFRRAHRSTAVRTTGALVLPDTPFGAHRQLLAVIDDRSTDRAPVTVIEDVDDLREATL